VATSSNGTTAPDITITSPVSGTSYNGVANMVINTKIATALGTIQTVEFFANNIKIGEEVNTPYSFTWKNVAAGTYVLTAKATNKAGRTSTSLPVEVIVNNNNSLLTSNFNNTSNLGSTFNFTASPNPTQNRSLIQFTLTEDEEYKLHIYDLKGLSVKTLGSGNAKANEEIKFNWTAANLPKGIYNATLTTSSQVKTIRIVLQ
jgi:hypothetical protein